MNEDYKQYIRSFVPGRLRLRHPGLKGLDGETVATVVETVTAAEGITGCTINPVSEASFSPGTPSALQPMTSWGTSLSGRPLSRKLTT